MDGLFENFRIALHQVWQRRWLALAVAWVIAALGWAAISFIPNSYEAKAKLFAQVQQVLPSEAGAGGAPDQQGNLLRLKQTLTSAENLTRVVRRTELNALATTMRRSAPRSRRCARRSRSRRCRQSVRNFRHRRFRRPVQCPECPRFGRGRAAARWTCSSATAAPPSNQPVARLSSMRNCGRREQQLQAAEQRRVEFEQRNVGVVPGAGSAGDRMSTARAELAQLDQTIVTARSAIAAMQNQLQGTPATMPVPGGEASYGGPATSQLAGLQAQLSQYLGRGFTEQHPDVISLRSQIRPPRPAGRAGAQQRPGGARRPSQSPATSRCAR
jgi:hypothetical protein